MSTKKLGDLKNNNVTQTEKNSAKPLLSENEEKIKEINEEALFDSLMESIGNDGKFQNRLNFVFNFIWVILGTMPFLNLVLVMAVPEHWCHVPGRESTNYTVEEWKDLTIPKEKNKLSEIGALSSCQMFDFNGTNSSEITDCKFGWDYNREWYTETAPSLQNWVCDREIYVTNVFAAARIGEIIGVFIGGQLGDQIGRRPVFYMALTVLLIGRISSAFTSYNYSLFIATIVIGSLASINMFQSPLVICMEISAENKRAQIAFIQCLGWVIGMSALPMVAWVCKDWALILLCTTIPCAIYFFTYKLLPESPRWLATKGQVKKSAQVLKYIASVNKTKLPDNTYDVLQKIADKKEKFYGVATLFFHKRLAKNTIIIVLCWCITSLSYYTLVLNVSNMAGNPFMNFFWQAVVELPAFLMGKYLSDFIGRRWTQSGTYLGAAVMSSVLMCFYNHLSSGVQVFLVSLIKLTISCTFYIVWLQAMEIYPTCVRQTGTGLGSMMANIFGIFAPYVVFLGTSIDAKLPYVLLFILTLLGAIASSFLPETLNRKLPETLEDAKNFGKDQKYWSFTKPKKSVIFF